MLNAMTPRRQEFKDIFLAASPGARIKTDPRLFVRINSNACDRRHASSPRNN